MGKQKRKISSENLAYNSSSSTRQAQEATRPQEARAAARIRFRAVALALLLTPLNAFMLLHTEVVRFQAYPTSFALFGNVIGFMAVLMLLNALIRRRWPRAALTAAELLVFYMVLCAASAVGSDQSGFLLVGIISHVTWFATPTNHWKELYGPDLPAWLTVQNREALRGYYLGASNFWQWEHIAAWMPPLLLWLVFLLVLVGVMLCINTIVRRPWTDAQRLTYPIVTLPMQMVDEKEDFFRSRLMWAGVAIVSVIGIINGLHMLYPSLPEIPRYVNIAPFIPQQRPWSAFPAWRGAEVDIGIFPFVFGLGLLMPLDLVFSCWFFYLLTRFLAVWQSSRGLDNVPGFPFDIDQASGAFLGIFLYLVWQIRGQLGRVLRKALWNDPSIDDSREPMRYRTAVLGILFGMAFLIWFSTRIGMSAGIALIFFVLYFAVSLGITRMRAEAGITNHDIYMSGPEVVLINAFGSQAFSRIDLSVMSLFYWFNRAYDGHPMPQQIEGFKLGEKGGMSLRALPGLMLLGTVAGALSAFLVMLTVMYQLGAASGKVAVSTNLTEETWARLANWVSSPTGPNWVSLTYRSIGGALSILMLALRTRGVWCPFHPVGIAMTGSWFMFRTWSSLMFSWLVKYFFLRYGGRNRYGQLVQFALGMVLGDCVIGCFWAIIGASYNIRTFNPWP
jgi:hypothetical protein